MRASERLRRALLRWDRLLSALALGLPVLACTLFGFLWLLEHGYLLLFIGFSALAAIAAWLARRFALRGERAAEPESGSTGDREKDWSLAPDPDWLPREREVYLRICARIEATTRQPLAWDQLGEEALRVVDEVARELGKSRLGALHFTVPEALLLLERSAARYRRFLLARVPFADRVSLGRMHWLWRQRSRATLAWKLALGGRRLARFAVNPTAGLLRELEQLIAGDHADYLSEQMQGLLQAVLLEEVAFAAVELHSGRLRVSDHELRHLRLQREAKDQRRMAAPDQPLRVVFVGQLSAGKSTLINALLPADRAETDAAATTADMLIYPTELDGLSLHLIDSRGLDSQAATRRALLQELREADLVVWVLRANRPAREADRLLKQDFDEWFAKRPQRRKPPVLAVATAIDLLGPQWPYPEHELPAEVRRTIEQAVMAMGRDLDLSPVGAVSALAPTWNLEALVQALVAASAEGQLVQRNRRRLAAAQEAGTWRRQAGKGARGLWRGGRQVGGRLARRLKPGTRRDASSGRDAD